MTGGARTGTQCCRPQAQSRVRWCALGFPMRRGRTALQQLDTTSIGRLRATPLLLIGLIICLVQVCGCPKPAGDDIGSVAEDLRMIAQQDGPMAAVMRAEAEAEREQTADAYERLAQAHTMARQGPEAVEALNKALAIDPGHPRSVLAMSVILIEQGKHREAQEMAENLLDEQLRGPAQIQVARARALLNQGEHEAAMRGIEVGLEQHPGSAALYCVKADTLLAMGDVEQGEAAYREALRLDPTQSHYVRGLTALLLVSGRAEEAAELARDATTRFPEDPMVQLIAGDAMIAAKDIDGAIAAYEEALILSPDLPPAANNLALLLADRKEQLTRAEHLATEALARDKRNNLYADTLGWVWVQQGQYEKGITLLREVIKHAPDNSAVKYHLGTALVKSGSAVDEGKRLLNEAAGDEKRPQIAQAAKDVLAGL